MTEIRSCSMCKHFNHHEGSGCETCWQNPWDSCDLSDKTNQYTFDDESAVDLCVIAMRCKFFEWHPEIAALIQAEREG